MKEVKLQVEIADAALCPRYQAVVMELPAGGVRQKYLKQVPVNLAKSGMRSIDPVVDSANLLMLLTGQPLHTFDYDKFVNIGGATEAKVIVRAAKNGEKMELLDGKIIEMSEKDIVITSNNIPVALAGAMGGANTAVDKNTKRILVESATFNLYNMRGTQFRHGIFSEAITRFTKGQPPALTDYAIRKFVEMSGKIFGLKAISEVFDCYPKKISNKPIKLSVERVNEVLGSSFDFDEVISTLENVGFKVKLHGDIMQVTAPWWRTDIHIPENIIEEIGRLNGFDNILAVLPMQPRAAIDVDEMGNLKSKIRDILSGSVSEVLTYSFVNAELLKKANQDPKNSYKIVNSISPDLQFVRQTLTPSLLDKAFQNLDDGFERFALFEQNKVTQKRYGLTNENVPVEKNHLAFVIVNVNTDDAYYIAKNYLERVVDRLGMKLDFRPLTIESPIASAFEPKHSADVFVNGVNKPIGVLGDYKKSILKNFDLPNGIAGFEINLDRIVNILPSQATDYTKSSRFPNAKRDVTFRVVSNLEYIKLENLICRVMKKKNLWFELFPISIYQNEKDKAHKNISFRLKFASFDKTLLGKDISAIIDSITKQAKADLKAEII